MLRYIFIMIWLGLVPAGAQAQSGAQSGPIRAAADIALKSLPDVDIDNSDITARLAGLRIQGKDSEAFSAYHGAVIVRNRRGNNKEAYLWGGSACPGKDLRAEDIALLASALAHKMWIRPNWKPGASNFKCLTAFELLHKDDI